jgi:hypothetical protein
MQPTQRAAAIETLVIVALRASQVTGPVTMPKTVMSSVRMTDSWSIDASPKAEGRTSGAGSTRIPSPHHQ